MWVVGILLAILALALLILGLRGRRVDDHPFCRKCRFDLLGILPEIRVCPECGADLAAGDESVGTPRSTPAIGIGNRRRRRALIVLGSLLLLLAGGLMVTQAAGVNWDRYKPFAWIRFELKLAGVSDPKRSSELLAEILSRLDAERLTARRLAPIVDQALLVQADPDATWTNQWGEIIERYDETVGLTKDQLFAYLKGGSLILVMARDSVRIGDKVLVRVGYEPTRIGNGRKLFLRARVVSGSLESGDSAVPIVPPPDWGGPRQHPLKLTASKTARGQGSSQGGVLLALDGRASELGPHPLSVEFKYELVDEWDDEDVLGEWTQSHDMIIAVVPRDDSDIALMDPTAGRRLGREDIVVDSLAVSPPVNGRRILKAQFTIRKSVPLAFRAAAISGDTRIDLGSYVRDYLRPGGDRHFRLYSAPLPADFDARSIAIEFKYDRDVARERMSIKTIYPLDVLIEDVSIEWPDKSSVTPGEESTGAGGVTGEPRQNDRDELASGGR